jgi:hypothetical protein
MEVFNFQGIQCSSTIFTKKRKQRQKKVTSK